MKRLLDFTASLFGLIVLSPLLVPIAIWIKLDSPGPVFYRGERAGRHGRPFRIFKFRSMVQNAPEIGGPSTSGDDTRVTRSGKFIRACKFDELSQLINVLYGDMSLVGPRPEVLWKTERFTEEEKKTLTVRPGITDWASIWNADEGGVLAGAQNPDAVYEMVIRPTKLRLQLYYLDSQGFWTDIKIILYTLIRLARKDWVPRELKGYSTFAELRAEVDQIIVEEKAARQEQESVSR